MDLKKVWNKVFLYFNIRLHCIVFELCVMKKKKKDEQNEIFMFGFPLPY